MEIFPTQLQGSRATMSSATLIRKSASPGCHTKGNAYQSLSACNVGFAMKSYQCFIHNAQIICCDHAGASSEDWDSDSSDEEADEPPNSPTTKTPVFPTCLWAKVSYKFLNLNCFRTFWGHFPYNHHHVRGDYSAATGRLGFPTCIAWAATRVPFTATWIPTRDDPTAQPGLI